jgi:hypothetical protein
MFVKQIPNLKSLTISSLNNMDMINADRWENLIKSSLPYLDIFKFKFSCYCNNNQNRMIDKLKQFQSDFWHKEHHWYTEYSLIPIFFIEIYTITYPLMTLTITFNSIKYIKRSTIFIIHFY